MTTVTATTVPIRRLLGLAVLDAPSSDGEWAVWHVTLGVNALADKTNAVIFPEASRTDRSGRARVDSMLAERLVLTTQRTVIDLDREFVEGPLQRCDPLQFLRATQDLRDDLHRQFLAENRRRRTDRVAVIKQPRWPELPLTSEPRPDLHPALGLADLATAVWRAWNRLEAIRMRSAHLRACAGPVRALPEMRLNSTHDQGLVAA